MSTVGTPLGVICLGAGCDHSPEELAEDDDIFPWAFTEDAAYWPVPISTAAMGSVGGKGLLHADEESVQAVYDAAKRLDGHSRMIIGNCGFMWPASARIAESIKTPTLTSGLDFLDLALRMTSEQVGVITWCQESLTRMLADHPQRHRIRLCGLRDLPLFAHGRLPDVGYDWEGKGAQLIERLRGALADGGELDGVRLLILECTFLPNLRSAIRQVTELPMLDIVSFTLAAIS